MAVNIFITAHAQFIHDAGKGREGDAGRRDVNSALVETRGGCSNHLTLG